MMPETTRLQLPASAESRSSEKAGRVLTVVGVMLYTALRFWRLTQFNLQRDEIFSLETARLGWRALLAAIAADVVHPPLFYIVLKLWIFIGGESLPWLRLLSTFIAIVTVIPFLLLCRELRLPASTRNIALFLFAVNGYLIAYAHELRMYSLVLCFSLLALWLFVRWWNNPQTTRLGWAALFSAHLLLVYTHYYGWLIVGVELLFVLLWQRRRGRWFAALFGLLVLCYAPWLAAVLTALKERSVGLGTQLSWHTQPGIVDVAAYYAVLNGSFPFAHSTTIGLLIFGGVILWAVGVLWRRSRAKEPSWHFVFSFLIALALVPAIVAFAFSHIFPQSVWHARYLIISAVPYLMLVACALSQLRPRWLKVLLIGLVVIWAGLSGVNKIQRTEGRILWDVLTQELRNNEPASSSSVKVYVLDDFNLPRYPMGFYLKKAGDNRFQIVRATAADITQLTDDHLWVMYKEGTWPFSNSPQQSFEARGYRIRPTFASGPRGQRYILFAATR